MAVAITGQLGGLGVVHLGGNPEPGDLLHAKPGVIRHYQCDAATGGTALLDRTRNLDLPLVRYTLYGDGYTTPTSAASFQADGAQLTAVTFTATDSAYIYGEQVAGIYSGHADYGGSLGRHFQDQGSVEFSFKLDKLPIKSPGGTYSRYARIFAFADSNRDISPPYGPFGSFLLIQVNGDALTLVTANYPETSQSSMLLGTVAIDTWYTVKVGWVNTGSNPTVGAWINGFLVGTLSRRLDCFDSPFCLYSVGGQIGVTPGDTSTPATPLALNDLYSGPFRGSIDNLALFTQANDYGVLSASASIYVTAANFVSLSLATTRIVGANHSVDASNAFTVAGDGDALVHEPTEYEVSAANSLSALASSVARRDFGIAATSLFYLWGDGNARNTRIVVDASNDFLFRAKAAKPTSYGPRSVEATTTIRLTATTASSLYSIITVSASNAFSINMSASMSQVGPRPVSATTSVLVSQVAAETNPGPRPKEAASGVTISDTSTLSRFASLAVEAQSVVTITDAGSESADFAAASTSPITLAATSDKYRGLPVAATSSIVITPLSTVSNLKSVAASSGLTFDVAAISVVGGTEASSGLRFSTLAHAVAVIPWRPSGLTLPPGGNLPHS